MWQWLYDSSNDNEIVCEEKRVELREIIIIIDVIIDREMTIIIDCANLLLLLLFYY